jgi:hypothetical protein
MRAEGGESANGTKCFIRGQSMLSTTSADRFDNLTKTICGTPIAIDQASQIVEYAAISHHGM